MSRTRLLVNVAAIVFAVVFAQETVLWLFQFGFAVMSGATFSPAPGPSFLLALPVFLLSTLVLAAGLGGGVFVSLRWLAPIVAALPWRGTVLRGVLATAAGAIAVLLLRVIESLLAAIDVGPYPLGYSFTATFNSDSLGPSILDDLGATLSPFVYSVPLVVLACVFLKLWLAAHPEPAAATDRASVSA